MDKDTNGFYDKIDSKLCLTLQNIVDDDMFSNFVSAPAPAPTLISSSVTPSASTNSLTNTSTPASNLEEDFFNQVIIMYLNLHCCNLYRWTKNSFIL